MAIGGISPISAYSSMAAIQPLQYKVKNESEISDAYSESMESLGAAQSMAPVDAPSPVAYPTAQKSSMIQGAGQTDIAKKVAQAYNNIASGFADKVTSYSKQGSGEKYEMLGNSIDLFA